MNILLVAATSFEIVPTQQWLEAHFERRAEHHFSRENLNVHLVVTGVGSVATAFRLGHLFAGFQADWAINAGIAGAFDPALPIGTVVQVQRERFGDLGVEEADGRFTDMFEMGFAPQAEWINPMPPLPGLPVCNSLTVNKVHGAEHSIQRIREKYPEVQVESMEGAAFFYACQAAGLRFCEIRAISNKVEPRNREAWDIPLAITRLNEVLISLLEAVTPA